VRKVRKEVERAKKWRKLEVQESLGFLARGVFQVTRSYSDENAGQYCKTYENTHIKSKIDKFESIPEPVHVAIGFRTQTKAFIIGMP
jgi:hypothetical protein